jgi:hypothetical protein
MPIPFLYLRGSRPNCGHLHHIKKRVTRCVHSAIGTQPRRSRNLTKISADQIHSNAMGGEGVEGQENGKMLEVPLPDSDHSQGLSEARSPLPRSLSLSPSVFHQGSSHRRGISTQWKRDHTRKKAAAVLKQINLLSLLQASTLTRKHRKLVLISRPQD